MILDDPLVLLAVIVLAVYRGTLLVTGDRITRAPRRWLRARLNERGRIAYLMECPWCASWWLGIVAAVVYGRWPHGWWRWPALAMAASGVTGLLATIAAPDENDHED